MAETRIIHRGWLVLGALLSLALYWNLTDLLAVSIEGYAFLPLLSGWLASRFGLRVAGVLLGFGLLSVFGLSFYPLEFASVAVGFPLDAYLVSIAAALAFASPRPPAPQRAFFTASWRWLRWLVVLGLGVAALADWPTEWTNDDLTIGTNVGFVLVLAALAGGVDWGAARDWWGSAFPTGAGWRRAVRRLLAALLASAFVFYAAVDADAIALSFGYASGSSLLFALAFVVVASGLLDWRLVIALLIGLFAVDWAVSWVVEALTETESTAGAGEEGLLERIIVTGALLREPALLVPRDLTLCVGATLLGVALAPFWRHQDPSRMRTGRSMLFVFLALIVSFGLDGYSTMLIGGIAFAMGLIWRVRGVIAGPLIIQLVFLSSLVLTRGAYGGASRAADILDLGLVAFPFAFFGLLANRFKPGGEAP